ncbi:MAG: hypothetical protein JJ891_06855 [Rhizobiaceae bacterium]|nr:hypothetical protein [Rhizobiaceae bacterium]
MISVGIPTEEHVLQVMGDIREDDLREWWAGTGIPFEEAIHNLFENLDEDDLIRYAYDEEGTPLCFWGCSDGCLWLFATNSAYSRAIEIHRNLKPELANIEALWSRLSATADARNLEHHKWLGWLGFEKLTTISVGPFNMDFIVFVKETR